MVCWATCWAFSFFCVLERQTTDQQIAVPSTDCLDISFVAVAVVGWAIRACRSVFTSCLFARPARVDTAWGGGRVLRYVPRISCRAHLVLFHPLCVCALFAGRARGFSVRLVRGRAPPRSVELGTLRGLGEESAHWKVALLQRQPGAVKGLVRTRLYAGCILFGLRVVLTLLD